MEQKYKVIFSGDILPEFVEEEVRANLLGIFKGHADQIDLLFVGGPVVVKSKVDGATAEKYRAAFARAGALCEIIEIGEAIRVAPVSDPPEAGSGAGSSPGGGPVADPVSEDGGGSDSPPEDYSYIEPELGSGNRDTGLPPDAPGSTPCAECGIRFYRGEMISCCDSWVCESCEPVFAQKRRKGKSGRGSGKSGLWARLKSTFSG